MNPTLQFWLLALGQTCTFVILLFNNRATRKNQFKTKLFEETKLATIQAFEAMVNFHQFLIALSGHEVDTSRLQWKEVSANKRKLQDDFNKSLAKLYLYIGESKINKSFSECAALLFRIEHQVTIANFYKVNFFEIKERFRLIDESQKEEWIAGKKYFEEQNKILVDIVTNTDSKIITLDADWNTSKKSLQHLISKYIKEEKLN